jgi:hypothetical protein
MWPYTSRGLINNADKRHFIYSIAEILRPSPIESPSIPKGIGKWRPSANVEIVKEPERVQPSNGVDPIEQFAVASLSLFTTLPPDRRREVWQHVRNLGDLAYSG